MGATNAPCISLGYIVKSWHLLFVQCHCQYETRHWVHNFRRTSDFHLVHILHAKLVHQLHSLSVGAWDEIYPNVYCGIVLLLLVPSLPAKLNRHFSNA